MSTQAYLLTRSGPMNRAVVRWQKREGFTAYLEALTKLAEEPRVPASEVFEALQQEPPAEQGTRVPRLFRVKDDWRQEAQTIGLSDQEIEESWAWYERNAGQTVREPEPESVRRVLTRCYRVEDDWRRDARAAGLSKQEVEESWTWFSRNAYGVPRVLEEAEQAVPETMPESVRRVLTRNSLYLFLGEDPLIDDLVDQFTHPIPDALQREADDWRFWDDVAQAWGDPSNADVRRALDRLARLVRLKPERVRHLAERHGTTMAAEKRRLVQEALLLSLGAAEERIRIGKSKTKEDPGHPITPEDVFGREGLQDILKDLAEPNREPTAAIREKLQDSLGGPFRPAHLADRAVYRNWLTKEIRRRVDELLGQDLDVKDANRAGGSRRKEVSYDETEPLPGVARGELGADAQAFTDRELRALGEREDRETASFRTTDDRTRLLRAAEKKHRLELGLALKIDWDRVLDRIRREREAPVLRQYIDCVRHEPLLLVDDGATARRLGWPQAKVYDVKRRLNRHIAQIRAEQRWRSRFPNA